MVVLEDADLELAATAALEAAYLCAGQSCTAGERFLVHAAVRAEFTEPGGGRDQGEVRLGRPVRPRDHDGPAEQRGDGGQVRPAHRRRRRRAGRGSAAAGAGPPASRPRCSPSRPCWTGSPRAWRSSGRRRSARWCRWSRCASAAQALELTNASPFGLTAAVFTADLERGLAFAERARAGWVNINASTNLWESHLPFGGRAGSVSGRGRVGGRYPMDTFTEPKTVVFPAPRYA